MKKIFLYNMEESKEGREIYKKNYDTIMIHYNDDSPSVMIAFINNNVNGIYLKHSGDNIWIYREETKIGVTIELRATTVFVKEAIELETIIYV